MISKSIMAILALIIISPIFAYAESGTISANAGGNEYSIIFETDGVEITSIESDMDFLSLILGVDVTGSPGILEITFERELFDTVIDDVDEPFIILADGDEPTSEETETTLESRTLRIELASGTEELEIIGEQLLSASFGAIMIDEVVEEQVEETEEKVMEETEEKVMEETEEEVMEETEEEVMEENTCGEGTVLKDGECVLDESCGEGTHLEDGTCVLDEKTGVNFSFGDSDYQELMVGSFIAFGIAFAVIIIFAIIARGRKKNQESSNF